MDLKDIHDMVLDQVRKIKHGQVSHQLIDRALHRASLEKFNDLTGNIQEYQAGRPAGAMSPQITDKISDDLAPFLQFKDVSPDAGEIKLPPDYEGWPTLRNKATGQGIDFVTERELSDLLNSAILAPTAQEPIARLYSDRIRVYPLTTSLEMELVYLEKLQKPKYAESGVGRAAQYSRQNSVQMKWRDSVMNSIINKAAMYIGQFLDNPGVMNVSAAQDTKGI